MTPVRIFISSVQSEFIQERGALRDYMREDALLRRFFEVFLFEDAPASNQRPDELYLDEVERCDLYVGLFGWGYGSEDDEGVSPTEREFDRATALGVHRLIFVKGAEDGARHPRMRALIGKAQAGLIRKRFNTLEELKTALYAALVEYLEARELLRSGPFDAAPCADAALDDLDPEWMTLFVRIARRARNFPLPEDVPPEGLLKHLNLLNKGRLTNAAVLLFGKSPQRFLISSEIKCAHFHGTEVEKPIPSYQVYKGTLFQLVEQAVDFVLGKIDRRVGTRSESARAPRTYEIPPEVVTEAVVNAVAHRDYTSNGSVQVMLFSDRLEVRNPGRLLPPLTLEELRVAHNSVPGNPLLAEPLYLAEYIERMGTGTLDMIRRCVEAGLPEPEFAVADGFVTTVRRAARPGQAGGQAGQAGVQDAEQCSRTDEHEGKSHSDRGGEPWSNQSGEVGTHIEGVAETTAHEADSITQEDEGTTQEPREKTTRETRYSTQETGNTTQERILALLAVEPALTRRLLAERLGMTADGVKYYLDRLRAAGTIRHVGATKAGRWEVLTTTQEVRDTTQEIGERITQKAGGATRELGVATQEIGNTTQERILALLEADPKLTRRLLAERLGITADGVKYHLNRLRAAGTIRHVGATKTGRWEVLK